MRLKTPVRVKAIADFRDCALAFTQGSGARVNRVAPENERVGVFGRGSED